MKYEFTDADLELVVLKVYRKASSYFLDQIYDDENVWEKAEIGYFFGKTDTEMFMSYVEQNGRYENVNGLVKSIVFLKHRFEEMNVNFMVSFDVREKVPFDIDVIVSCVNEKIKEVVNSMGKEEGYLLCMEYVSELVLYDVVVDNSLVDDMKYFAGDILKK